MDHDCQVGSKESKRKFRDHHAHPLGQSVPGHHASAPARRSGSPRGRARRPDASKHETRETRPRNVRILQQAGLAHGMLVAHEGNQSKAGLAVAS